MSPPHTKLPRLQRHKSSTNGDLSPLHKAHSIIVTPKPAQNKDVSQNGSHNVNLTNAIPSTIVEPLEEARLPLYPNTENVSNNYDVSNRLPLNHDITTNCDVTKEATYFPPKSSDAQQPLNPNRCDSDPQFSQENCDRLLSNQDCDAQLPLNANRQDLENESFACAAKDYDAHLPLNANRGEFDSFTCGAKYLNSGSVNGAVGSPEEMRRNTNKMYYRKLHKYLLFRSDQQLLCEYLDVEVSG